MSKTGVSCRRLCSSRCAILVFVFSWPENHNVHHRTSTESIFQSMCDIGFCNLLARKSQRASSHIDRLDVRYRSSRCAISFQSMCDIGLCILLARKSQHASSRIDRLDVRYLAFVFSWPENHNVHHRTSTDSICQSMCDIGLCILLARKSTCIIAHRPTRFASRCAISVFVISWPENHNMHHRTSTDSILQSMCDIGFCILLARNHNMYHRASTDSMCDT